MPIRPMGERLKDPAYASGMVHDPLLTGGAVLSPEDIEGLFDMLLRVKTDPQVLASKVAQDQWWRTQSTHLSNWVSSAPDYMRRTLNLIPQAEHAPGLVRSEFGTPRYPHTALAYLNKALAPMATLEYAGNLGGAPGRKIYSMARSFAPEHGSLPMMGLMRLLRELGKEGGPIDPGIYSHYTANLIQQGMDLMSRLKGKVPR